MRALPGTMDMEAAPAPPRPPLIISHLRLVTWLQKHRVRGAGDRLAPVHRCRGKGFVPRQVTARPLP